MKLEPCFACTLIFNALVEISKVRDWIASTLSTHSGKKVRLEITGDRVIVYGYGRADARVVALAARTNAEDLYSVGVNRIES